MKNLIYWIPIFGIAHPSCTMDKFKNPKLFGFYHAIFCLIALALLMGSCISKADQERMDKAKIEYEANRQKPVRQKPVVNYSETPRGISVQVIDNCQYIYAETGNGVAIIHKANCDNPYHPENHYSYDE